MKRIQFSYSYLNLFQDQGYSKFKYNKIYYNDSKIITK